MIFVVKHFSSYVLTIEEITLNYKSIKLLNKMLVIQNQAYIMYISHHLNKSIIHLNDNAQ